ncbi:MAG: hypothetical protein ABI347_10735 [Nitrososphaera sp.]
MEILTVGKTSLVSLDFKGYITVDLLAEIEIKKKQGLLKGRPELARLFLGLEASLTDLVFVRSVSIINAEKNLKLRRAELLVVVRGRRTSLFPDEDEVKLLHAAMHSLQTIHNLKLDYLIITDQKLLDSLAATMYEINPVGEMISKRIITIYGPQNFWNTIRVGVEAGLRLQVLESETVPANISEADLAFNLAKAGYRELRTTTTTTTAAVKGKDICIEYIVAAVMAQGDARRIEAIPVILAKQEGRINYDILIFLAQKYRLSEVLLGLMSVYVGIVSDMRARRAVELLHLLKVKGVPADRAAILEKMRLYNVVGQI